MKRWIISSALTFGALAANSQSMNNPNANKALAPIEQLGGLYARQLAGHGSLAIAFDSSFTGESGGMPRYKVLSGMSEEKIRDWVRSLKQMM